MKTMLPGFRSRWTIPFSCAASRASAICCATATACATGRPRPGDCPPLVRCCDQRLAVHQFQDQRRHAVGVLESVDGADVRVIERRQHARLALEARAPLGIGAERRAAGS